MMLTLNKIAAHIESLSNFDVLRFAQIVDDETGEQAQAQRVITVGRACRFDLGACAFHF